MILLLSSLHFPIKIPSKFQVFSNTPSWTPFFRLLMLPGAKMLDFGTPLAPSWAPNGDQNRPGGPKKAPKKHKMVPPRAVLDATSFQDRFRSAPGHHFGRFWMDLGGFCIIFHEFWMDFCSYICRPMLPFLLQATCRIQSAIYQINRKKSENSAWRTYPRTQPSHVDKLSATC